MKGTIFDVKEFSIHDGPGSRITLFLKGCPLRCVWCHNPEGLDREPILMHKKSLCAECGLCYKACSHEECRPYSRCLHTCPNGALTVCGKVEEAEDIAARLRSYFDTFPALHGITVSGGEPLMQPDFVIELCENLDGIHKAIQTSGFASPDVYKSVIGKFDYVMQDIKLADAAAHKLYTGVGNEQILKNIEYLKGSGKDFIFRVPLIPGITDTEENLKAISEIVGDFPVELLRYNALAGAKYESVGKSFTLTAEENDAKSYLHYFKNAYAK